MYNNCLGRALVVMLLSSGCVYGADGYVTPPATTPKSSPPPICRTVESSLMSVNQALTVAITIYCENPTLFNYNELADCVSAMQKYVPQDAFEAACMAQSDYQGRLACLWVWFNALPVPVSASLVFEMAHLSM